MKKKKKKKKKTDRNRLLSALYRQFDLFASFRVGQGEYCQVLDFTKRSVELRREGWMTRFYVLSTVLQSYRVHKRLVMKGCVQLRKELNVCECVCVGGGGFDLDLIILFLA